MVVLNMVVGCVVMPLLAKVKSLGMGEPLTSDALTPCDAPEPLDSSVSHVVGKNESVLLQGPTRFVIPSLDLNHRR